MELRYDSLVLYDSPPAVYDSLVPAAPTGKFRMKIKLGMDGMNEAGKIIRVQDIVTHLTGNSHFLTPNPTLVAVQGRINLANAKLAAAVAAATAARMAGQEKRDAIAAIESDYALLANYVENVAAGNEAFILSAGYELRSPPLPVGLPAQVTGLATVAGAFPGQLVARWDGATGSVIYELQTNSDPNVPIGWVVRGSSTSARAEIPGLTSGAYCWTRVRAVGSAGPGPWSDPSAKTVP